MTPPAGGADLSAVVTALEAVAAAVGTSATDLAPLAAQVERVADAAIISNTQISSVIGTDTDGDNRVRTDPNVP